MDQFFSSELAVLGSLFAGYFLGALPLADQVSRRNGIDIFSMGTGLAGSTNVRKYVGRHLALIVLLGDVGKGVMAVVVGRFMGLDGPWLMVPASAAVFGHWKSVFSRFRGGDGLATFGGTLIGLSPIFGLISVGVSLFISLGAQKLPYSSLLNIVFGYVVFAVLNFVYGGNSVVVVGVGGLAVLVLGHALLGHYRRRGSFSDWDKPQEEWDTTEGEWSEFDGGGGTSDRSGIQHF